MKTKHKLELKFTDTSKEHLLSTSALPVKQPLSKQHLEDLTGWTQEKQILLTTKLKQHQLHILVRRGLLETGIRGAKTRFYRLIPGVEFVQSSAVTKTLSCPICATEFPQIYPKQRFCSRKCGYQNRHAKNGNTDIVSGV